MLFNHQVRIRFSNRRGVTLLEVLFSMGIVSVGLLGTILLIPLAAHEAAQGARADISARVGKNAFQEATVAGLANPGNWLYQNGNPVRTAAAGGPHFIPAGEAFAIDSRFIAFHALAPTATGAPTLGRRYDLFPYVYNPQNINTAPAFPPAPHITAPLPATSPAAMPFMNRITVRSAPTANTLMAHLQADEMFVSQHDLIFEKSDDATFPPSQVDIRPNQSRRWDTIGFSDRMKRDLDGKFSWMLTVAPKVDVTQQARDLYTLSVLVFHERNGAFAIDVLNERIAQVVQFPGLGVGGGEVILAIPDPTNAYTADTVRVRSNDWIMLASQLRTPPPPQNAITVLPVFRWYRVVASSTPLYDSSTSPPTWTQEVTLHGPDWDRPEWIGNPTASPAVPPAVTTYAALVSRVSAVYEKTIRLETSSLWTNP